MSTYDRYTLEGSRLRPVAIVDLDSTVCDTRHRRWLAPVGGDQGILKAWEPYAMGCGEDRVIIGGATLARLLHGPNLVFLLSARNDCAEQRTLNWLADNNVPFDRLRLRGPDETDPDTPTDWKVAVVDEWMKEGWNVQLFVDDWANTCNAITEQLGIASIAPAHLADGYKPGH